MPIPVQHPNTVNTAWKVYIRTSPFVNLYNIYHRNFESPNREIREYSVIWFRQIWRCINELAGSDLSYGKGIYDVRNDYNPKNPIYGQILYETKKVYNRYDGKYYKILAILHFDFVIPYADNYGGRIVNITENKQYNTMNNTKKRIRFTESDLHRLIKEAINEYGGYDSLKQAYGEHDSLPFMRHLRRVGMEPGYTRTDAERFKMQDRQERNRQNLDPLHLKAVQKIPQDVRDMNQYRDMRLNVTEAKKSQSRPLPFYYQEPKKAKDSVRGRYLRYSPEDSNFSSEGENFGWIMQDSYNESEMNKLIDDALTSLNKARKYAKDGGHGRWYTLLNAICGELYHRVQNTDVRGLGPYAASSNIDM